MNSLKGEKILIGPSSFSVFDKSPLEYLNRTGCKIIDNPFKRKLTKIELMDLLKAGITGLIAGLEPLDREVMENSILKVISRCGAGMSNVDLEGAKALGIEVRSTPDAPTTAVAELTVGAMIALLRMIPLMDHDLHRRRWNKKVGTQLEGKTVVIIGYGRIGQKVASLLIPFKVNILVVDPFLSQTTSGISILSLEKALPEADIITIHSSGEDCVLGPNEFELIRPGTFVLNAARGGLIDENTLVKALEDGTIQGVWLDTFGQEPYDGPLTGYPQVVLTPHVGSYTRECRLQMEMESVRNLVHVLKQRKTK